MIFEVRRCWLTGILSVLVFDATNTLGWYDRVRGFVEPGRLNRTIGPKSVYPSMLRGVASWSYRQQRSCMKGRLITLVLATS
jgi:hypothetical protein